MPRRFDSNEPADTAPVSTNESESPSRDNSGLTRSSTIGVALADARPREPVGVQIARSRVAAGLFGSSEGSGVGRFQLLNRLGAGGMGVIYAAFDPELERAVAVKLVHIAGSDRSEALAEAKALARLSHPNVVTIFDYGFLDEHLYIVMELVIGQTLKRWAKARTQREILKAYRQAGEALAAAHAAGLIHRDFKPDNALMGADGRVRVVDFGLACEATSTEGEKQALPRAGGTPGYMAPEQISGESVTAATDQFGFCVALQGALQENKAAAIPRWLQLVIDRGRATNPHDRFPNMSDLLQALSRDPAVIRRRWLAAGAFFGASVLAAVLGRATSSPVDASCNAGPNRLASTWSAQGRLSALDRVTKLSEYGRSLRPLLERELVDHSRRWAAGYHDACQARAQAIQSPALTDRRMACLERGRAALSSLRNIFEGVKAAQVPNLILAVRALPDPDACSDLTALLSESEPPPRSIAARVADLRGKTEQARIQIAAGTPSAGGSTMEDTVHAARELAYKPLLAESLAVLGHAKMSVDDPAKAEESLTEAFRMAFETGLLSLGVEAWARRAWRRGVVEGREDSLSGFEVVEAVATSRSSSRFSRALLYNNIGCIELSLERRDRARQAFQRASSEARELSGPGAAELLNINDNLGLVTDDPTARERILQQAETEKARVLGNDHPETIDTRLKRGLFTVNFGGALETLAPACAGMEAHHDVRAVRCWMEVAFIRGELRDRAAAVTALQRAATFGDASELTLEPYLLFWQGDLAGAARGMTRAIANLPSAEKQRWWERFERAELELGLGRALRALGQLKPAQRALLNSVQDMRAVLSKNSPIDAPRRLGRARAELAHVLLAQHQSRVVTCALAASAALWLRQAHGSEEELHELGNHCTNDVER